jgi:hypothetical protein
MGKFVSGIDLRDPWGNPYQLDPYGGFVFSMGPDGKHHRTNKRHQWNLDDVLIPYIGALGIETASIECNPLKEKDKWLARDVLHLVFNKPVTIVKNSFPFVMNNISDNNIKDGLICNNHQLESIVANYQADLASPRFCFRWCKGESDFYIDGSKILQQPNGIADTHEVTYGGSGDPASVWTGTMPCKLMSISDGKMFHTKKSMEVVIVLPKGTSGSILPDTHYINLTGNIKNKYGNTLFREFDQITPAVISSSPHLIKRYEKKNSQL